MSVLKFVLFLIIAIFTFLILMFWIAAGVLSHKEELAERKRLINTRCEILENECNLMAEAMTLESVNNSLAYNNKSANDIREMFEKQATELVNNGGSSDD